MLCVPHDSIKGCAYVYAITVFHMTVFILLFSIQRDSTKSCTYVDALTVFQMTVSKPVYFIVLCKTWPHKRLHICWCSHCVTWQHQVLPGQPSIWAPYGLQYGTHMEPIWFLQMGSLWFPYRQPIWGLHGSYMRPIWGLYRSIITFM